MIIPWYFFDECYFSGFSSTRTIFRSIVPKKRFMIYSENVIQKKIHTYKTRVRRQLALLSFLWRERASIHIKERSILRKRTFGACLKKMPLKVEIDNFRGVLFSQKLLIFPLFLKNGHFFSPDLWKASARFSTFV